MNARIVHPCETGSVPAIVTVLAVIIGIGLLVGGIAAGAVSAKSAASENITYDAAANDVTIGEQTQSLAFKFGPVSDGEHADVYVNVTSLETAGIDLESAQVDVTEIHNANLTDVAVVEGNGTVTVRLSLEFHDGVERAFVDTRLTGLDTSDAVHETRLHHYVAVSEDRLVGEKAPDRAHRSVAYDVVEPASADGDERPHTQVSPRDVAIGGETQTLRVRIAEATADFRLDVDLTPLVEAGVAVDEATVEVEQTDRLGVSAASVEDGTVHLDVAAEAETGYIRVTLQGLDTGSATPTEGRQYPVSVDGDPAEPHESTPFDVYDPDERDDGTPVDDGTVTPTVPPVTTEGPGGGDGNSGADQGTDTITRTDTGTPQDSSGGGVTDTDTAASERTADARTDASGDGFSVIVALGALLGAMVFVRFRPNRG